MAIVLVSDILPARATYQGSNTVSVPAGQWVNVRYGTPEAPTDDLLVQVPAGKTWTVTVNVHVQET